MQYVCYRRMWASSSFPKKEDWYTDITSPRICLWSRMERAGFTNSSSSSCFEAMKRYRRSLTTSRYRPKVREKGHGFEFQLIWWQAICVCCSRCVITCQMCPPVSPPTTWLATWMLSAERVFFLVHSFLLFLFLFNYWYFFLLAKIVFCDNMPTAFTTCLSSYHLPGNAVWRRVFISFIPF